MAHQACLCARELDICMNISRSSITFEARLGLRDWWCSSRDLNFVYFASQKADFQSRPTRLR